MKMKFKTFNQDTLPKQIGGGSSIPRVSLGKAGTINFNGAAATLMNLSGGSKISLVQDEDDTDNWYFFKDEKGFELRIGYDKKGVLFNHSVMIKAIVKHFDLDEDATQNFKIAGIPTKVKGSTIEYWGIIAPVKA